MPAVITDVLQTRLELVGLGSYTSGFQQAGSALGIFEGKLSATQQRLLDVGVAAGAGAAAIAVGLGKSVQAAGRLETIRGAFTTIEGSAEAADSRIRELQNFAATTPFDFEQSVKAAQQLRAMGVSGSDLIPTMRAVGEAVSAAGGGTEEFTGALRALGQIQTKGKLSQEELNQLAERGVPAMRILARELNLTQEQLQNVGAAGIPAEKALDALRTGFQKDFGGSLERQSKTLEGALSNLGDSLNQAAMALGTPLVGPVTGAAKALSDLIGGFNSLPDAVKSGVGIAAAVLGGVLVVKSAMAFYALHKLVLENQQLTNQSLKNVNATRQQAAAFDQLARSANGAANAQGRTGGGVKGGFGGGLKGTVAGLGIGIVANEVASRLPEPDFNKRGWSGIPENLKAVIKRSAQGAEVGSIAGPQGSAVGAVAGALEGAIEYIARTQFGVGGQASAKSKSPEEQMIEELKKTNEELRKQTASLDSIREKGIVGADMIPVRTQLAIPEIGRLIA